MKAGPLSSNHNLGASFKKGTSLLIQEIFLFTKSVGKPVFFGGINYGRRPITIMPFISVTRMGREFMDGPGSEKTWVGPLQNEFREVCQKRSHLGGPGACSPRKIFQILVARIALVATFCLQTSYHQTG